MKQKFKQGDKIFAKVRGYPPWPARVEGIADETPSKLRYHVFFYGTGETAVVKGEEICLFAENRHKLGKPKKQKGFTEALLQIEDELSASEKQIILAQQSMSENDDSVATDSEVSKSSASRKSSISTPMSPKSNKKKRKSEAVLDGESEAKNQKLSLPKDDDFTSRSGRKIKPKRFADFNDTSNDESKPPVSKPTLISKSKSLDQKLKEDYVIANVDDEVIKIPLKINRPNYTNNKSMEEWDDVVFKYALSLKNRIESGENFPEGIETHMKNWTQNKLESLERAKETKQEFLRIETAMLDIDVNIKNSLSLKEGDLKKCLDLLDELSFLNLTPLMLKKHPEVVDTIKKTRKYVGNMSHWKMTDNEKEAFKDGCCEVRKKSELIYNKFKTIFLVPTGRSFWDIFNQDLEDFHKKTGHLTPDQLFSIVKEPM